MSQTFDEQDGGDILSAAMRVAETVKNAESYDELAAAISHRRAEQNDFERAVEVADTINDPYARDKTLAEVAVKCAAVGQEDYAFELLESLEDVSHQATGISQIAIAHSSQGDFDHAIEIASGMDDSSATLAEIAGQCAAKGEYERAHQLVEMLDFPLYLTLTLSRIAESHIKAGRIAEALELLSEALDEAEAIDPADEKATTLAELALRFAEAGEEEQAAGVLNHALETAHLAEQPYQDTALAQVAASHARLKQYERALEVAEEIEDDSQAATALVSLANIEREDESRQEEALQLLSDAFDLISEKIPDTQREETQQHNLFALIATPYAEFGQIEPAVKIAQCISIESDKHQVLSNIAVRVAQSGRADEALQTARAINDGSHRANALIGIARTMLAANAEDERGLASLAEALQLAENPEHPADRVFILTQAANAYAEAGQTERGIRLVKQALEQAQKVTGEYQKASALLALADACAKTGYEPDEKFQETLWDISAV